MAAAFGADRPAVVCRELTKLHEEVRRGPLSDLAAWADDGVRGEIVIVVGGAAGPAMSFEDAVAYVSDLLAQGKRLKDACAEVAAASGHSSRELYNASLS